MMYCKTVLILITGLITGRLTLAQDTLWYTRDGDRTSLRDAAAAYDLRWRSSTDTQEVKLVRYSTNGTLLLERNYNPFSPRPVLQGAYKIYSAGKLVEERMYQKGIMHGTHKTYWPNGNIRRADQYEKGAFRKGKCFATDGADTSWFEFEAPASFPGGRDSLRRFIERHFYYPSEAKNAGIQGTVLVSFSISKEGVVGDILIKQGVHPLLDSEAMRLVAGMPPWSPGIQEGVRKKSMFVLPIAFRLPD